MFLPRVISEKNKNKFYMHVVVDVGTTTCTAVYGACYDELCGRHHFGDGWGTAFYWILHCCIFVLGERVLIHVFLWEKSS